MKKILFSFILISLFSSCGNITSEFKDIDLKTDTDYTYKISKSYGDYTISFYSSQSGGYGTYGQQIRDYSSGKLESILLDNDECFTIRSNAIDAKSSSTNVVTFEIEFPKRIVSSISIKAVYTAPENAYIESSSNKEPKGLSKFSISYLPPDEEKEKTLEGISKESFSSGLLDKTVSLDEEISYIKVSAEILKYYQSGMGDPFKEISGKKTESLLSIYKIILE